MARVPVATQREVAPTPMSGARFEPADYGAAGRMIGESVERLGEQAGHAAKIQDQINAQLDEAGAKHLDNEFVRQAQAIRADFLSQQGLNAGTARASAEQALGELAQSTMGQATTGRMRRMLGEVVEGRQTGILGEFASHAQQQITHAKGTALSAGITLAQDEAIRATDPAIRAANIQTGLADIATLNQMQGNDAAVTTADQAKFNSGVHLGIAKDFIVNNSIDRAVAYRNEHIGDLTADDARTLAVMLHDPLERRETYGDVDGLMGKATGGDATAPYAYGDPLHGAGHTPVPGGQFGAPRVYGGKPGTHKGADLPAPMGAPLYAIGSGTVEDVTSSPLGGTIIRMRMDNGDIVKFDHVGKVKAQKGDQVTPDTVVGTVGMTGHTTGPHVHMEIIRDGKPLDPQQTIGHVQQSPQRHDLNALLRAVDQRADAGGWDIERRERAKAEVQRRVGRDEQLQARTEDDAQRQALDQIAALGGKKGGVGFTDMSQLSPATVAALSPSVRLSLMTMAGENKRQVQALANSGDAFNLHMMAIYDPEGFKHTDLRMYQNKITPSELTSLAETQGKMRTSPGQMVDHTRIWGLITHPVGGAQDLGLDLGAKDGKPNNPRAREMAQRIFNMVQADVNTRLGGQRQPTDDELKASYDRAVRTVTLSSGTTARAFQIVGPASGIPDVERVQIQRAFKRRYQRDASDAEIADLYHQAHQK